jgi:hypothetical protein
MRPLDVFTEKTIKDGSPDKIACSSALVYEAQALALQRTRKPDPKVLRDAQGKPINANGKPIEADFNSAVGFGKRDQMALASLAFCSPLMMLGMGAALGLADNGRMNREHSLKDGLVHRPRQVGLEKQELPKERTLLSMPTDTTMNVRPEATRKTKLEFKNRKDNVLYPNAGAWRQPSPERSWVKASKLVKRKQHLSDQLQKCRGLLQLSVVSAILSKIERLDKELKKMGC